MKGLFLTFEGTECSGKSTQVAILAERLRAAGQKVRTVREPGGTAIGEEIRHILKHSEANRNMTAETELLLMNASRAQLVGEIIAPALAEGEIVLCDRFYDSTLAYQAYGRGLDRQTVRQIISFAVGAIRPDVTILLTIPVAVSEQRRQARQPAAAGPGAQLGAPIRDRMEEEARDFFERVEEGYRQIAAAEPRRIRVVEGGALVSEVGARVWSVVEPLVGAWRAGGAERIG